MRRLVSSGSDFEAVAGYSRAVVDGEWIFVSGTTGFDYANDDRRDPVEQARQVFRNIEQALGRRAPLSSMSFASATMYRTPPTGRAIAPVLGQPSVRSARPRRRSSVVWSIRA